MRKIQKGNEPAALQEYRKLPDASYDGFPDKDALRESIVDEQRGLCCYCMGRISPDSAGMKIEHCQSQEAHPDQALNYRNLLGACKGGEGSPPRLQHCDTKKGRKSLSFNPCAPDFDVEARIQCLGNGEIAANEPTIRDELGKDVLNLNLATLVSNRKAVLDAFQKKLTSGKKLDAAKELPKWDGSQAGKLPPYAQIVVYYLRKKLRTHQ